MVGLRFKGRLLGVEVRLSAHLPREVAGEVRNSIEYAPCKYLVSQAIFDMLSNTTNPERERFTD